MHNAFRNQIKIVMGWGGALGPIPGVVLMEFLGLRPIYLFTNG